MREAKYRGKQFHSDEWHIGSLVTSPDGRCFIGWGRCKTADEDDDVQFFGIEVLPETVGQYAGAGMYEGDIFRQASGLQILDWDEQFCKFCLKNVFEDDYGLRAIHPFCPDILGLVKIGNIHDNPELLE